MLRIEMSRDQGETQATLWRAFGRKAPPEQVTQEAFDFDDRHLRRLARLRPGERAEAGQPEHDVAAQVHADFPLCVEH
jgi:hypothetical protein